MANALYRDYQIIIASFSSYAKLITGTVEVHDIIAKLTDFTLVLKIIL